MRSLLPAVGQARSQFSPVCVSLPHPHLLPTRVTGFELAIVLSAVLITRIKRTGSGAETEIRDRPRMMRETGIGIVQGTGKETRSVTAIRSGTATGAKAAPRPRRASGVVDRQVRPERGIGRGPRSPRGTGAATPPVLRQAHLIQVPEQTHLAEAERRRSPTRRVASASSYRSVGFN